MEPGGSEADGADALHSAAQDAGPAAAAAPDAPPSPLTTPAVGLGAGSSEAPPAEPGAGSGGDSGAARITPLDQSGASEAPSTFEEWSAELG